MLQSVGVENNGILGSVRYKPPNVAQSLIHNTFLAPPIRPSTRTMAPNHAPTALISPELYDLWARADRYHCSFLLKPDPVLDAVMENTKSKEVESEQAVSPAQGKFMHLLMLSMGAKRVLEVGSLGG